MATAAAGAIPENAAGPTSQRPSRLLTFTEGHRALFELATLPLTSPLLLSAPRGDGHTVMVLPGFMTSDVSTRILRRYIRRLGYSSLRWELGRNLGPRAVGPNGELLLDRLKAACDAAGDKVSLVGWSLGGVLSAMISQRAPEMVRSVITLGSPLRGSPKSTTVWRVYEMATGQKISSKTTREQLDEIERLPKVPTSAIYSKADGVVPWQNCRVAETPISENIEVHGSHCGLGVNGSVLYAVADRLAQPQGEFTPFEPRGLKASLYP